MKFDVCEIHVLKVSNWQSFSEIINREMKENVYKRLVWQIICVNAVKMWSLFLQTRKYGKALKDTPLLKIKSQSIFYSLN